MQDGVALEIIRAAPAAPDSRPSRKAYGRRGSGRVRRRPGAPGRGLECTGPRFGVGQLGRTAAVAAVGDQPTCGASAPRERAVRTAQASSPEIGGLRRASVQRQTSVVASAWTAQACTGVCSKPGGSTSSMRGHPAIRPPAGSALGTAEGWRSFCAAVREGRDRDGPSDRHPVTVGPRPVERNYDAPRRLDNCSPIFTSTALIGHAQS